MCSEHWRRGIAPAIVCVALFPFFAEISASGVAPERIHFQGLIRDASNIPLEGGATLTFRFYAEPEGGLPLWEETYDAASHPPQVAVTGGVFDVALGDGAHRTGGTEAAFADVFLKRGTVYVGLKAEDDAEMVPRIEVLSAPFCIEAHALDGRHADHFLDTGPTAQTKLGQLTINGTNSQSNGIAVMVSDLHYGIALTNSATSATVAGGASCLNCLTMGPYVDNAATLRAYGTVGSSDVILADLRGGYGVDVMGSSSGGRFQSHATTSVVYLASEQPTYPLQVPTMTGVWSSADEVGGYFTASNAFGSGTLLAGTGGLGLWAVGSHAAARFTNAESYAEILTSSTGIDATGEDRGARLVDRTHGAFAHVADGTNKVLGNGSVSFVQNHPTLGDRVIVYHCPEGDEVATYTRGTATLEAGGARVDLGETFRWVTNPDIGLTAHVTPRGACNGLYVEALSTTELTVRELGGGASDVSFDYLVYGLRIGFEESAIVQEKKRESFIPSFREHREAYARHPELRAFNALERFKAARIQSGEGGALDLSGAEALRAAIHEYDPAGDPPVERLLGLGHVGCPSPGGGPELPPSPRPALVPSAPAAAAADELGADAPEPGPRGQSARAGAPSVSACLPASEPVSAAEVVVMDPLREGEVAPCRGREDAWVVGVSIGQGGACAEPTTAAGGVSGYGVPVATSGIVACNADATFGPIRRGDLLATSPTAGYAMRAASASPGTVLGKALESLEDGRRPIRVLLMLR